jgi:glycosyltransferase involved in cell wall biosynthesis
MKILHLRASNFYGGPERQIHFHARLAAKAGYKIIVGSFSENGISPKFLDAIAADNIETHLFDVKNAYDFGAIGFVRKYLKENNINILCTHDYRSHFIGYRAVRRTQAGWVAFSRGWTKDSLRVRLYTWLEKFIVRFADHIVAVSEAQKRKLVRLLIPESKITTTHNAIDIDFFANIVKVDLRKRFNLPDDSIIVVAGGRFSREKGQKYLIAAAAQALKQDKRLKFIIYGDGPDYNKIVDTVRKLNLNGQIICPGFEKDLLGCLKGADILVNPSLSEGLPNIVLEAMAMGIPVIATAVGGVPELIHSGVDGIMVPPGDGNAIALSIIELAGDANKRSTLAAAARSTVGKFFAYEKQLALLETVYRRFIQSERPN